jgi:hypothetical protein
MCLTADTYGHDQTWVLLEKDEDSDDDTQHTSEDEGVRGGRRPSRPTPTDPAKRRRRRPAINVDDEDEDETQPSPFDHPSLKRLLTNQTSTSPTTNTNARALPCIGHCPSGLGSTLTPVLVHQCAILTLPASGQTLGSSLKTI